MAERTSGAAVSEGTAGAARYWDDLASGRLSFQRCGDCGTPAFPPRVLCPHCLSDQLDWQVSGGSGTVYCCTYAGPDQARTPLAMVVTDEGFVVPSRIIGAGCESVGIGSRVALAAAATGDRVLPVFELAAAP
jgi:uncharacterized protein